MTLKHGVVAGMPRESATAQKTLRSAVLAAWEPVGGPTGDDSHEPRQKSKGSQAEHILHLMNHPDMTAAVFTVIVTAALNTAPALHAYLDTGEIPDGWDATDLLVTLTLGCAALEHPACPADLLVTAVLTDRDNGTYRQAALSNPACPKEFVAVAALFPLSRDAHARYWRPIVNASKRQDQGSAEHAPRSGPLTGDALRDTILAALEPVEDAPDNDPYGLRQTEKSDRVARALTLLDHPDLPPVAFADIVTVALRTAGALDPGRNAKESPDGWSINDLLAVMALGCAALRHPACPVNLLHTAVLADPRADSPYRQAALDNPACPDEVRVAAALTREHAH